MKNGTLMFTIGVNGYDKIYRSNIESHKRYAEKQGYTYCAVTRPYHLNKTQAAWLKIFLINIALECDYEWVFFIDADCEIKLDSPSIQSVDSPEKHIFMAHGFSGRLNSGVIAVKNDITSRMFFKTLQLNCERSVESEDWGENGHVIFYAKFSKHIKVISRRWNNNIDPELDDYVRHYSRGSIMGDLYPITMRVRVTNQCKRYNHRIKKTLRWLLSGGTPNISFSAKMEEVVHHCRRHYRQFHP